MRPSSSKRFPAAGRFFAANLPVSANLDASLNSSLASRRSLIKASLLAGAGLGASACAKLPTSGPVRVADHDVRQADLVLQYAQGPVKGASPTQIVEGFLLACAAGYSDEFATARSFLLGQAASSWRPDAQVWIYDSAGNARVSDASDGSLNVSAPALATLDAKGVYSVAFGGANHELTLSLATDGAGQWRIAALPDGVLLSATSFQNAFVAQNLYFFNRTRTSLVPDRRWVLRRRLTTHVVSALLTGPAPWLNQTLSSAIPDGVTLGGAGVEVSQAVATVDLSSEVANASANDKQAIVRQLATTLGQLGSVNQVIVNCGSTVIGSSATIRQGHRSPGAVVAASAAGLVRLEGNNTRVLLDAGALGEGINGVAVADANTVYLQRNNALERLTVSTKTLTQVNGDTDLGAVCADNLGWVWLCQGANVLAYSTQGVRYTLAVPSNLPIAAFNVSSDGYRLAYAVAVGESMRVSVCAVVRDDKGVPTGLGEAYSIYQTDVAALSWVDEVTVAVLAKANTAGVAQLAYAPVGGMVTDMTQVTNAERLVSGKHGGQVSVLTDQGQLMVSSGATWVPSYSGLKAATYSRV